MSRILTQEEVDALLGNELPGGLQEPEDPTGRSTGARFDLRAPLLAAGKRLATLEAACESLSSAFSLEFGQVLGLEADPGSTFEELAQLPASQLLGGLAQGSALGLIEDESGQVVGGITLEADLTGLLLDRLQGGRIGGASAREKVSDIDRSLLRVTLARLVRGVARVLNQGQLKLSDVDPEPASGQLACRGGTLCAAQFRLSGEELDHRLKLLLTADLARLMTERSGRRHGRELDAHFLEELGHVPVRTRAVIDGITFPLGELERIGEGSVLQLGVIESATVGLEMNGLLVARGSIRSQRECRSLEISEFVNEEAAKGTPPEAGGQS